MEGDHKVALITTKDDQEFEKLLTPKREITPELGRRSPINESRLKGNIHEGNRSNL